MGLVPFVELAERLESDAIELADVVEALVDFYDMYGVLLELLAGTLALLLEVNEVSGCGCIVARQVVVFVELTQADASLLTDGRHVVSNLYDDEVALVALVNDMPLEEVVHLLRLWGCGRPCLTVFARVELVETVHLYDANEGLGIGGTGGITCGFQSASPTLIVCRRESEEPLVALLLQELRVVDVALPGAPVLAEAVIRPVVTLNYVRPVPVHSDLDAEVVVGLSSQPASARITLQEALCKGDGGGDAILVHLLDGPVLVLVDVSPVGLVGALCLNKQANGR